MTQWLRETIKPVACGGAFPSVRQFFMMQYNSSQMERTAQFLGRHELPARVAASFGENWERLVELKMKYDPTGLFRNTFWPLDKDGREMNPSEHEPPEPEM
jgi:Berberine and berberine like